MCRATKDASTHLCRESPSHACRQPSIWVSSLGSEERKPPRSSVPTRHSTVSVSRRYKHVPSTCRRCRIADDCPPSTATYAGQPSSRQADETHKERQDSPASVRCPARQQRLGLSKARAPVSTSVGVRPLLLECQPFAYTLPYLQRRLFVSDDATAPVPSAKAERMVCRCLPCRAYQAMTPGG